MPTVLHLLSGCCCHLFMPLTTLKKRPSNLCQPLLFSCWSPQMFTLVVPVVCLCWIGQHIDSSQQRHVPLKLQTAQPQPSCCLPTAQPLLSCSQAPTQPQASCCCQCTPSSHLMVSVQPQPSHSSATAKMLLSCRSCCHCCTPADSHLLLTVQSQLCRSSATAKTLLSHSCRSYCHR